MYFWFTVWKIKIFEENDSSAYQQVYSYYSISLPKSLFTDFLISRYFIFLIFPLWFWLWLSSICWFPIIFRRGSFRTFPQTHQIPVKKLQVLCSQWNQFNILHCHCVVSYLNPDYPILFKIAQLIICSEWKDRCWKVPIYFQFAFCVLLSFISFTTPFPSDASE